MKLFISTTFVITAAFMVSALVSAATLVVTIVFVISSAIVTSDLLAALVMLMLCFGYAVVQVRPFCFELSIVNLSIGERPITCLGGQ